MVKVTLEVCLQIVVVLSEDLKALNLLRQLLLSLLKQSLLVLKALDLLFEFLRLSLVLFLLFGHLIEVGGDLGTLQV